MSKRNCWIYLVGSLDVRPVKIGSSFSPEERLMELQVGSPVLLRLLWKTKAPRALERSLHEHFAPYRIHGEWFDFGDEDPLPLVISVAALMGFWARPERVAADPRFVSREERRENWLAVHGDELYDPPVTPSAPRLGAALGMPELPTFSRSVVETLPSRYAGEPK